MYGNGYTPLTANLASGIVTLTGLIKSAATSGVIAVLPESMRPKERQIFQCLTGAGTVARVDVEISGSITLYSGNVSAWVSLQCSFPAAWLINGEICQLQAR
ncbi:hypothetical protein SAMN02745130_00989 [Thiothrix eikelboomii]|uniref:Uncharacterized protein n=1 Tax=Thiothrix eikelboomii TaxID=92487 RepID=A0A1T4W513_9GAMM|nr:hypothetical protein [Thiothrix eikelboomii]SKA72148.1 hypothetical protein SAMN02745130_00989 [Thiothrix eikelboomii]